jgi:hypothetical protein
MMYNILFQTTLYFRVSLIVNIGYNSQTISIFVLILFTHYFSLQANPFNKLDLFCLCIVFVDSISNIILLYIQKYVHTTTYILHPPTYEQRNVLLAIYSF